MVINDFGGVYLSISLKSSAQTITVCVKIKLSNKNIHHEKVEKVIRKRLKMKIRAQSPRIPGAHTVRKASYCISLELLGAFKRGRQQKAGLIRLVDIRYS